MWDQGVQESRNRFPDFNEELKLDKGYLEEHQARIKLYKFLYSNITFATELIMGVKLFPFQHIAIKAMLETDYFLGVWSRGCSKSFSTGIFAALHAIFNQGVQIGIISKSFRQCLGVNDLCLTETGIKPIKDVKVGENIFSEKGLNKIVNKWSNDPAEGIKMTSSKGFSVRGKNEHRVLCLNKTTLEKEYKDLCDLTVDDVVGIQLGAKSFNNICNIGYDDAYFYGTVVGDGCISKNKYIPESIMNGSEGEVTSFLKGLFDSDGTVGKDRIELATSSKRLASEVQLILTKFGIISKIQKEKGRGESTTNMGIKTFGDPSFKVRITGAKYISKFVEEIGFQLSRKRTAAKNLVESLIGSKQNLDIIYGSGEYLSKRYSFPETLSKNLGRDRLQRVLSKYSDRISKSDAKKLSELSDSKLYWDKVSCVKSIGEIETIDIEVENEHCYSAQGFVNHNSKMIFKKIEDIAKESDAELLRQCITKVSKNSDEWVMEIGKSKITALPLGDGEKLRGFRFGCIIIDEFLLMPSKIFNEVIMPFLSVVTNPTERADLAKAENELIKQGKMKPEDRYVWKNNKLVTLSSASYKFEYMYEVYCKYEALITGEMDKKLQKIIEKQGEGAKSGDEELDSKDNAHRTIMHMSYDCVPKELYDQNLIKQGMATMSQSQFDREFNSVFTDDSSGYFKIQKMAECTFKDGMGQCIELKGDRNAKYIVSFDPSWSENEGSDDWALHVFKLDEENKSQTLVHSYAISGANMTEHAKYFKYILDNFNVEMIVGDRMGGLQFIQACNQSAVFKEAGIELDTIESKNLDDKVTYQMGLREIKNSINKESGKMVFLRHPSSNWIREANEKLQANFTHKKMLFACEPTSTSWDKQVEADIPINSFNFKKMLAQKDGLDIDSGFNSSEEYKRGMKVDFLEHLKDMIDLTKAQCSLIQVFPTSTGQQRFDLPPNLRKQTGPNKTRKDSYSALVLGNWGCQIYYDMNDGHNDYNSGFVPTFV